MPRKNSAHDLVVECLTTALLDLMKKKPFSLINISELCERAGVSRASFYRNFNSKEDILLAFLKRIMDEWWQKFEKKPQSEFFDTFWSELIGQYSKNKEFINLLIDNNLTYIIKDHIFMCCRQEPDCDEFRSYVCSVLAGAVYGYVDEWCRRGMKDKSPDIDFRKMLSLLD